MKQQSIAVAVVTTVLGATGGDRWLYVLEDKWTDLGLVVTHVYITGSHTTEDPLPSARVRTVRCSRADRRARFDLPHVLAAMWREIRRADVVLLEPQGLSAPLAFLLAKVLNRRTAIYSQGVAELSFEIWEPQRWRRALIRLVWRHVDAVMCVSPASHRAALRQRVAREKIQEVRTAVDIDDIRSRALNPVRLVRSRPLLVGCGTVSAHKGFDRIILAVSELKRRGVVVDLLVVGRMGEDAENIASLVESHGLTEQVTLMSQVPDAVPYIAQADVFVHAARYDTVSLVLLEALSLGVPVIALDEAAGGPRLVLRDGVNGCLLEAGASSEELADALQAHLENPHELQRRAAESEAYVRQEFSVPRAAGVSAILLSQLGGRQKEPTAGRFPKKGRESLKSQRPE